MGEQEDSSPPCESARQNTADVGPHMGPTEVDARSDVTDGNQWGPSRASKGSVQTHALSHHSCPVQYGDRGATQMVPTQGRSPDPFRGLRQYQGREDRNRGHMYLGPEEVAYGQPSLHQNKMLAHLGDYSHPPQYMGYGYFPDPPWALKDQEVLKNHNFRQQSEFPHRSSRGGHGYADCIQGRSSGWYNAPPTHIQQQSEQQTSWGDSEVLVGEEEEQSNSSREKPGRPGVGVDSHHCRCCRQSMSKGDANGDANGRIKEIKGSGGNGEMNEIVEDKDVSNDGDTESEVDINDQGNTFEDMGEGVSEGASSDDEAQRGKVQGKSKINECTSGGKSDGMGRVEGEGSCHYDTAPLSPGNGGVSEGEGGEEEDDSDTPRDVVRDGRGMRRQVSSSRPRKRERWTKEEHAVFLDGLDKYGRRWKKVHQLLPGKTLTQVRTHAYGYFAKLMRRIPEVSSSGGGAWNPNSLGYQHAEMSPVDQKLEIPRFPSGTELSATLNSGHNYHSSRGLPYKAHSQPANDRRLQEDMLRGGEIISLPRHEGSDDDLCPRRFPRGSGGGDTPMLEVAHEGWAQDPMNGMDFGNGASSANANNMPRLGQQHKWQRGGSHWSNHQMTTNFGMGTRSRRPGGSPSIVMRCTPSDSPIPLDLTADDGPRQFESVPRAFCAEPPPQCLSKAEPRAV